MAVVKITVNNHGSLKVTGNFEICDSQGQLFDLAGRETIGLCRCGYSQNKPCLLYTSPSPRDRTRSRMPSSA